MKQVNRSFRAVVLTLAGCLTLWSSLALAADYNPEPPLGDVASVEYTWHDAARDRDVPVKIFYPKGIDKIAKPAPVIIFSHGLGGSREGYHYVGQYWAGRGYVVVHPQHLGSDSAVWKNAGGNIMGAMQKAAMNPKNAADRCKDVSFVIDQLETLNASADFPLKGKLDLTKIGMAGHSFGGHTTMAIAGQAMGEQHFADPRVTCAIAMSPPTPFIKLNYEKAYAAVKLPVYVMTGTEDNSPIGDTKAADRRAAYDYLKHAPAYLITFTGADHMTFGGDRLGGRERASDKRFHQLILQSTAAFWDAYLRNDDLARAWFADGGYQKALGKDGVFEEKNVK